MPRDSRRNRSRLWQRQAGDGELQQLADGVVVGAFSGVPGGLAQPQKCGGRTVGCCIAHWEYHAGVLGWGARGIAEALAVCNHPRRFPVAVDDPVGLLIGAAADDCLVDRSRDGTSILHVHLFDEPLYRQATSDAIGWQVE